VVARTWSVVGLIAATVAFAACSQESSRSTAKVDDDDPATVAQVAGTDLKTVTLSSRAEERLGIKTEQVREVSRAGMPGPVKAVPPAALIYDKNGSAWVYTAKQARTYVRAKVEVDTIEEGLVLLDLGPPPGTDVVIVGAAELLGVELGVGGG
jgi:hypothetical protein